MTKPCFCFAPNAFAAFILSLFTFKFDLQLVNCVRRVTAAMILLTADLNKLIKLYCKLVLHSLQNLVYTAFIGNAAFL